MDKAKFETYRFIASSNDEFMIKIFPEDPNQVILEYKNHFTGEIERIQDKDRILLLYRGLSKLENEDLEDKNRFQESVKNLLPNEQEAIKQMATKIKFKEKDTFYFYELWETLEDANEVGFFEGFESVTEVKNPEAYSHWEIIEPGTRLEKGFYCLSGMPEAPEFFELTIINLPFSRAKFLRNPDHWGLGFVQSQLIKTDEHTFKAVDEYVLCWDNPTFLFQSLLPVLQKAYPCRNELIEIDYEPAFPPGFWQSLDDILTKRAKRVLEDIPADDWAFVYELFEEAEKQGFLALYHNRNVADTLKYTKQINDFYALHTPKYFDANQVEPATEEQLTAFEQEFGEALPADYRAFLLNNRLLFSLEDNYQILSLESAVKNWKRLNLLKKEGAFDKILEENEARENWKGDYIRKTWWSEKWLPIAEDACANLYCIDFAPGPEGIKYQLNYMEIQDNRGPFAFPKAMLFFDLLQKHREQLKNGEYRLEDFGEDGKMIVIV